MKVNAETINLQWVENGEFYKKDISRNDIINIMKSLKNGFDENNCISTQLCEVLPNTSSIHIDKDRNRDLDVPKIICQMADGCKGIDIMRNHRIIWGIFDEYCKL